MCVKYFCYSRNICCLLDHGGHDCVERLDEVDKQLHEGGALAVGDALRGRATLHAAPSPCLGPGPGLGSLLRLQRRHEAVQRAADRDRGGGGAAEEGVADEERHVPGEGLLEVGDQLGEVAAPRDVHAHGRATAGQLAALQLVVSCGGGGEEQLGEGEVEQGGHGAAAAGRAVAAGPGRGHQVT